MINDESLLKWRLPMEMRLRTVQLTKSNDEFLQKMAIADDYLLAYDGTAYKNCMMISSALASAREWLIGSLVAKTKRPTIVVSTKHFRKRTALLMAKGTSQRVRRS